MVSLSLTSFMFVLLFIFLTLKVSIAHTDQENGFTMELTRSHQSVEKEVLDGVPAAAVLSTNGRKMMAERRNMKKNMKQVEARIKTEEDSRNSGASATHSIGNLNRKSEGKLRVMSSKMSSSHSVKVNTGSFVALNADYHMARPHPPKNN